MEPRKVIKVAIKGWVTSFRLIYSLDGMKWDVYDVDRVFGVKNIDPTEVYSFVLDKPFFATAVRINPVSW